MERLKHMKETLMNCVQGKMGDLASVDTGELGDAIDMIKDLEEAIYYATIVKSMEGKEKEEKHYYTPYQQPTRYTDMGRGRMYYGDGKMHEQPIELRDSREGMSPTSRRMYMESKELHHDKHTRMKELEKYMYELTDDIMEMIDDASVEEKHMLQEKLSTLSQKLV